MNYNCFLLTLLFGVLVFSEVSQAQEVLFNYSVFQNPDGDPYIETYAAIPISNVELIQKEGFKQGEIEILTTFSQGEEIVSFDKYLLKSPEIKDSSQLRLNILDLKRFSLKPGKYGFEASFIDINKPDSKVQIKDSIEIEKIVEAGISDITLMESILPSEKETEFNKSGLEMLPFVFPYYRDKFTKLKFYAETYNTDLLEGEDHLIQYYVTQSGRNNPIKNLKRFRKEKSTAVNIVIGEFDIGELASGNYDLNVEIRSKTNELIQRKRTSFQRHNSTEKKMVNTIDDLQLVDITNTFVNKMEMKDLDFCIGSVVPIVPENQKVFVYNVLEEANLENMKRFLYNFWVVTEPLDPYAGYQNYKYVVDQVQEKYGNFIKKGYESDRGYTYLKYGKPNHVVAKTDFDPGAYPYEIWQYYQLTNGQSNVKFVFYDPFPGENDYRILHSDARGEISNPDWEEIIYKNVRSDGSRSGSRTGDF